MSRFCGESSRFNHLVGIPARGGEGRQSNETHTQAFLERQRRKGRLIGRQFQSHSPIIEPLFAYGNLLKFCLKSLSSLWQILCTGSNPYSEDVKNNVIDSIILDVKHSPKWNGTEESKVCRHRNLVFWPRNKFVYIFFMRQFSLSAFDLHRQIVRKYAGQEALLTCSVVANPSKELTFVWYFNGEEVDAGDVREKKVKSSMILIEVVLFLSS